MTYFVLQQRVVSFRGRFLSFRGRFVSFRGRVVSRLHIFSIKRINIPV